MTPRDPLDPKTVNEMYGLEPVFESGTVEAAGLAEFVTVQCAASRSNWQSVTFAMAAAAVGACALPPSARAGTPEELHELVSPSVVIVWGSTPEGDGSLGSRVVVAPRMVANNCHALTCQKHVEVHVIGSPENLHLTLSDGLVSGFRDFGYGVVIQTSAPISLASSGGRLFDDRGTLVGMTTSGVEEWQNPKFAHPVDWVTELLERHRSEARRTRQ